MTKVQGTMKKFFKKKAENNDIYFKLHVDFGYWEDSPIPSKETGQGERLFCDYNECRSSVI